jgi:hypothetical protein
MERLGPGSDDAAPARRPSAPPGKGGVSPEQALLASVEARLSASLSKTAVAAVLAPLHEAVAPRAKVDPAKLVATFETIEDLLEAVG